MAEIKLLATDLDGTLIGSVNELPLYSNFRDFLLGLRERYETIWVACTGRTLRSYRKFFKPMRMLGVRPDYVIVGHAYIYGVTSFGYMPHLMWNLLIRHRVWASQLNVQDAIDDWHEMITSVSLGVTTVRKRKNRLCLRFDSEGSATVAADLLKEKVKDFGHLRVFRYFREVDVRSVPFTKGVSLRELCRHVDIGSDKVLAIGNGHNDISMFDPMVAGMTGCPSNSEPEVIEEVHKVKGHISRKRSLAGVLDILEAQHNDKVNSDLPEGWQPPREMHSVRKRRSSGRRSRKIRRWIVFGGLSYLVIMVFAYFEFIPGPSFLSRFLALPLRVVIDLIGKTGGKLVSLF